MRADPTTRIKLSLQAFRKAIGSTGLFMLMQVDTGFLLFSIGGSLCPRVIWGGTRRGIGHEHLVGVTIRVWLRRISAWMSWGSLAQERLGGFGVKVGNPFKGGHYCY